MSALSTNLETNDNLLPNRFRFQLKRAPNVEFWIQNVIVPGFSIGATKQPTPFVDIPLSGDHIAYESLGISMLVDAELSNYLEIYTWLRQLGFPNGFDQYKELLTQPTILDEGVTSEIILTILNGQQQPRFQFVFHGAFPIAIGSLTFDSTDGGLSRVVCNAEFKYRDFELTRLT